MKRTSKLMLPIFLLAGVFLASSMSNGVEENPDAYIEIPVYPGGYNIRRQLQPGLRTTSLTYRIRVKYPAAEIIEFYDSFFNGNGWIASFEICQRHWAEPGTESKDTNRPARQMFAAWSHPNLDLKVDLWLKHHLANMQGQSEVKVECRLQPKSKN